MTLRSRWHLLRAAAPAAVLLLTPACNKGDAPPAAPADVAAPAAPSSRLEEVAGWDTTAVDAANLKELLALADALAAEKIPAAAAASARLRLVAVAALSQPKREAKAGPSSGSAPGSSGEPPAAPPEGFDAATQLGMALVSADLAGPEGARLTTAGRMLATTLGLTPANQADPGAAAATFDGDAALALLDGPGGATVEADLVRLTARRALDALDKLPATAAAFADFSRRYGAFACTVCAAAGDVAAEAAPVLPCPAEDTSATCKALATLGRDSALAAEGPNRVVVALLERLGPVSDQPLVHKGLARSVALPTRPRFVSLPVQFPRAALPRIGGPATPEGFHLGETRLMALLTPQGAGLGHRATVGANGASPAIPDGRLASQHSVPYNALAGDGETAQDLGKRLGALIPDGPAPEEVTVAVGLHPETRSADAAATLDALRAARLGHFRFATTRGSSPVPSETPLLVRELTPELAARPEAAPSHVLRVAVSATHIDVWGPERDVAAAGEGLVAITAVREALLAEIPTGLAQGWRGDTLARLRLPLPAAEPAPEAKPGDAAAPASPPPVATAVAVPLDDAAREAVLKAVGFFRQRTGAGAVVHVTGAPDIAAGVVVDLARAIQEARPEGVSPIAVDVGRVWLGARCDGPTSCPTTLALAFSTSPVPGDGGLLERPGDAQAATSDKAPEKAPEPAGSEENCNRADINARMKRNTGRFRFCYEKELQLNPGLSGRAAVSFTIGLDGNISAAAASGDIPNKDVIACLEREIRKVTFAPPQNGPCVVRWPFVFQAQ